MHTFFVGKVGIMPKKYDAEFKARAVRLVRDHVQDYDSEWAAMKTIASRMGVTAETLRKWVRQDEINQGERQGRTSEEIAEIRRLKRENAELRKANDILKAASVSSRGNWTRNSRDLSIHRRSQGPVRGPVDLPGAQRAWRADRPENLLCVAVAAAVETSLVRPGAHPGPGRVLRAEATTG